MGGHFTCFQFGAVVKKCYFEPCGTGLLVHICEHASLPGVYPGAEWLGSGEQSFDRLKFFPESQQHKKASAGLFFSNTCYCAAFLCYFTSLVGVSGKFCDLRFSPVIDGVQYLCPCLQTICIYSWDALFCWGFFFLSCIFRLHLSELVSYTSFLF